MQLLTNSMEIVSVHRADPFGSRGRLSAWTGRALPDVLSCANSRRPLSAAPRTLEARSIISFGRSRSVAALLSACVAVKQV
jgi:hypothetical protein